MATKFMLRTYSLPFTFPPPPRFFSKPYALPKPLNLSLLSTTTTAAATTATNLDHTFSYGPSLLKGHIPSHYYQHQPPIQQEIRYDGEDDDDEVNPFDEENFTRLFDIAALRVPSEQCFALESRLRGHLLNWPRIRNIARVTGDEVEGELKKIVKHQANAIGSNSSGIDDDSLVTLNRRIYGKADGDGEPLSPVLYRDKLAKTFNSRGFVKFRHLANISRPKKREKREEGKRKGTRGIGRNEFALVEVVEEEGEEDLSGLLGDEFKGRKWRGSTRLLLLDERYANRDVEEMPEAIKVSVPTL